MAPAQLLKNRCVHPLGWRVGSKLQECTSCSSTSTCCYQPHIPVSQLTTHAHYKIPAVSRKTNETRQGLKFRLTFFLIELHYLLENISACSDKHAMSIRRKSERAGEGRNGAGVLWIKHLSIYAYAGENVEQAQSTIKIKQVPKKKKKKHETRER